MRPYTIALSIVVHVLAACAAFIAPLLATDELPAPRTATEFIRVVAPQLPEPPPPVRASVKQPVQTPRPDAAPLVIPDGIVPEPIATAPVDVTPAGNGVIAFGDSTIIGESTVPPPPAPAPAIVRVGGDIKAPRKIVDVAPVYPQIAREARVEGIVILEAVIAEDGAVRDVRLLRAVPLLDAAAVEAVRQWRFTPTLLNGQPVPVVMTITVAFRLR